MINRQLVNNFTCLSLSRLKQEKDADSNQNFKAI